MKIRSVLFFCLLISGFSSGYAQTPYPDTYRADMLHFAKLDSAHAPAKGIIVFTGSSSINKWQDIQDYFPKHQVLNRGFGGSQFSDLIYYADKVIYKYQPKQVFVYEGDNDIGAGEEPEAILKEAKQLREMIAAKLPKTEVIFISPKPSIARWNLREKYYVVNKGLQEYASKTKRTEFVDMWPVMIGKDGKPLPIFVEDGLHMTAEGYKIWAKVLEPYLK